MNNKLLREELDYDANALESEHEALSKGLNEKQTTIYDSILTSIYEDRGDAIFVYGHGGTGKTYLWQTIISKLRSEGKIVLAVASSGIASLLLPGGRTAHSRFKIPLKIDEFSTCEIKKGTQLAKLLHHTSLILWDEAPMNHRNCFEALDRSLRDILQSDDGNIEQKLFGGKTIVFGGDFRQILPVIIGGTRQDIVNASINNMLIKDSGDGIKDIVSAVYDDIQQNYNDATYIRDRAIITPVNETADEINKYVLSLLPDEDKVYMSSDSICKSTTNADDNDVLIAQDGIYAFGSAESTATACCCCLYRYKLNTIVIDDTGSANFTIFEKSAQDLIRVSAQQLATATNSNRFVLPPVVENVIGQTFVFQVSLETGRFNTSMQSFRVTRIFQSFLSAKVKIEEKDEDDADISGDGAPASPNGTENLIQSSDTDEEEK
ncbi:uncharacterized protein LOC109711570 [Ananas comosus]|uniref:ATP-dependent DNA helicase n=1 Tax=Ananas comosus TaxID=4615 RepID=A0A6P5F2Z9_ANACO|nr:uncharacterized protein LOC109711570 [Ananas comosus]